MSFAVDARGLEVGDQPAGIGAQHLARAHPGVEQRQPVAGIDDQRVLLQHHVVGRQEIVGQRFAEFVLRQADEDIRLRLAHRQRAVGHHRGLDRSELEAVEGRRLRVLHGRLGPDGRHGCAADEGGRGGPADPGEQPPTRQGNLGSGHSELLLRCGSPSAAPSVPPHTTNSCPPMITIGRLPAAPEHDPEKPAPDVIRGGYRFSEKIMLQQ